MRIKYYIYSVLFALLLGSCSKEDIEIKGPAKRTVLAYMIASTNLGSDIRANIRQMITVASNKALNGGNLVVYYSESKSRSYLFQIKEDKKGNIVTDTVRFYENQSAILPETMYKVIKETTELFPAESYGLVLSSHGTSWLPGNFSSLRSFGEENGQYMEITEMNEALEGFHFDFMLFDACYMSGIECAYRFQMGRVVVFRIISWDRRPKSLPADFLMKISCLPCLKTKPIWKQLPKVFMNTTAITIMLHTAQYL